MTGRRRTGEPPTGSRAIAAELALNVCAIERHFTTRSSKIGAHHRAAAAVGAPRRGQAAPGPSDGGAAVAPTSGEIAVRLR